MRRFHKVDPAELITGTGVSPEKIKACLKAGLTADEFNLEISKSLLDTKKCKEITDRMCDTEVLICFIEHHLI
jgi:hypothetical protein